ncbi:MAG: hypothetical protein M1818_007183 [Claussenomyces sp. TS43310]|nr:MAG: hypothetical protein M1818_007183 [Claussenomyces sp. TS43310]
MASTNLSSIAFLSSAALAAGAYLDAKLSISTDVRTWRNDRQWERGLSSLIQELGDTCTLYNIFSKADPGADALWFEGRTWSYGQLRYDVDRFAAILQRKGVKSGDCVAVFMTNSPEMVITIFSLSKLGAVSAFINVNLREATLAHCITVSTVQLILSTPDLTEFVDASLPHLSISFSSFPDLTSLRHSAAVLITAGSLLSISDTITPAKRSPKDLAFLIFTSGTTGNPKACAIRNLQTCLVSNSLPLDLNNPSRYLPLRTYSALPLFHGTALFTALCYAVRLSGTICLTRKFSTSKFWKEVSDSRATRILYVGEMFRYLLATPPSPYDRAHSCIVANGNGLRADIWEQFKERFQVPEIREFYRSTEGIARFDNFGSGVWGAGKVGFAGPIRRYLETDTFIIRIDLETEEPYRDRATGLCVRTALGEAGEVIGRVRDRAMITEYLNDERASEAKLLRDVFRKGDMYHRMGDVLMQDPSGWVHFRDRIGDTFRWKGENVSAGEVRHHLAQLPEVHDCLVFSVTLQPYDGQMGAAVITLASHSPAAAEGFVKDLQPRLRKTGLPSYAIPRLVRITPSIATGFSFKQAKMEYMKKGWQENDYGEDRLFWLNGRVYQPLDAGSWAKISGGLARL